MNPIFAAALEVQGFCRDQDWLDVAGVAARQGGRLDQALIWDELTPLLVLKEDRDSGARLRRILEAAR
jgi:hypothetical protein